MKKKLLTIMAVSTLALSLTGCGNAGNSTTVSTTETVTTEATTEATTATSTEEETTEAATSEETSETEAQSGTLDGLAQYLLDQGVVTGSTSETMYSYIGAIGGFKYLDSNVEVYEYDMNSDTYKQIVDTNSVSGLTVSAINGPYVLMLSNDDVNQSVIDVFNAYK